MFTTDELQRYNRHIILSEIGIEGQIRLKNAKVLVVGAGGLGCPVLQYLAAAGIGRIGIADDDVVSFTNLQRQILYRTGDVGKPKAAIAAKILSSMNPDIQIDTFPVLISKDNIFDIISDYEIVVDCSDNFPTRYLISDACVISGKTLVFGAIYKFDGQVSVFNYLNGPTYRCLFPEQPQSDDLQDCNSIGVLGILPGIIGCLQANEVLKICLKLGDVLSGKLLQFDALSLNSSLIRFSKDEQQSQIRELGDYETSCRTTTKPRIDIHPESLEVELRRMPDWKVIDLREKGLFESYNIGGENIDIELILKKEYQFSRDNVYVFVCEVGRKSLIAAEFVLLNDPQIRVFNLSGGIQNWISMGLPIKREGQ
jgi:adenylyltransferase/sulfurtransferase